MWSNWTAASLLHLCGILCGVKRSGEREQKLFIRGGVLRGIGLLFVSDMSFRMIATWLILPVVYACLKD